MERDIIERLRDSNPVDESEFRVENDRHALESVMEKVASSSRAGQTKRSRAAAIPVRAAAVIGAVVVVAGGVAVAAVTLSGSGDEITQSASVTCFASASANSSGIGVSATPDPISACANAWSHGAVDHQHVAAPGQLTGCVIKSGLVGVLPLGPGQTCTQLGFQPLTAQQYAQASALAALRQELVNQFEKGCLPGSTAVASARSALDRRGLAGWSVSAPYAIAAPQCAGLQSLDETTKTVTIIPTNPAQAPTSDPQAARFGTAVTRVLPSEFRVTRSLVVPVGQTYANFEAIALSGYAAQTPAGQNDRLTILLNEGGQPSPDRLGLQAWVLRQPDQTVVLVRAKDGSLVGITLIARLDVPSSVQELAKYPPVLVQGWVDSLTTALSQ